MALAEYRKGSESMLTAKQEAFVQNIIQGMSQADAYRSAYSSKRMSDNAVYREASLLVASPKIAQRLQELRDKMATPNIMTAQQRLEWLTGVINNAEEGTSEKLKAIDIMNKMQGEYTQKIEANVTNAVNINIELVDD
jgi:phage terminase small subunit